MSAERKTCSIAEAAKALLVSHRHLLTMIERGIINPLGFRRYVTSNGLMRKIDMRIDAAEVERLRENGWPGQRNTVRRRTGQALG